MTLDDAMTEATRHLMGFWHFRSASSINDGFCGDWAERVARNVRGARAVWRGRSQGYFSNHCAVLYRGKWYDAECAEGVSHWKQLPIFAWVNIQV